MHSLRTSEDTSARQYGGNFLAQRSFSCVGALLTWAREHLDPPLAVERT
jgi:hypothetical protein